MPSELETVDSETSRGASETGEFTNTSEQQTRNYFAIHGEDLWLGSAWRWYQNLNKSYAGAVLVLCYVNLINYMDRSTVAGMMEDIRQDPNFQPLNDKRLGLLQTAFVICYMH